MFGSPPAPNPRVTFHYIVYCYFCRCEFTSTTGTVSHSYFRVEHFHFRKFHQKQQAATKSHRDMSIESNKCSELRRTYRRPDIQHLRPKGLAPSERLRVRVDRPVLDAGDRRFEHPVDLSSYTAVCKRIESRGRVRKTAHERTGRKAKNRRERFVLRGSRFSGRIESRFDARALSSIV